MAHFFLSMEQLSQQYLFLVNKGTTLAVADLSLLTGIAPTCPLPNSIQELLSAEESALLGGFTFKKRYLEWLGGRITAKHSLEKLLHQERNQRLHLSALSILPDEHGRPLVEGMNTPPAVSISHSGNYAAALASQNKRCGVDVQKISSKLEKVAERFTSKQEKSLFSDNNPPLENLALIWATKEAIKKSLLSDHPETFSATQIKQVEQRSLYWQITCNVATNTPISAVVNATIFDHTALACTTGEHHA